MLPCIVGCSLKNSKSLFSKQPQASQASNHMVNNQVSMAWNLHELWCSTTLAQQHLWDNTKQGGPCCFCINASKQNSKEPTSTLLQFLSIKRVRTQQSAPCAFDQIVSSNIALIIWKSLLKKCESQDEDQACMTNKIPQKTTDMTWMWEFLSDLLKIPKIKEELLSAQVQITAVQFF